MNRGVVIVSFGTDDEMARKKSIDMLEREIKETYPDLRIYSAYMNKKVSHDQTPLGVQRDLHLYEVLQRLVEEKIELVYLQPTFMIEGWLYQEMVRHALLFKTHFKKMSFGRPLLTTLRDYEEVITAFVKQHKRPRKDEAVLCIGHGDKRQHGIQFMALDHLFKAAGYEQYYVATLRSYPGLTEVIGELKKKDYHKVYIYPFMISSGYHVKAEIGGEAPNTWKGQLQQEGYEVESDLKGLGEYPEIRKIYRRHVSDLLGIDYKEEIDGKGK